MDLTKQESRERWSQLRGLLCEWDPIGVMDNPEAPRDEYDCLIGTLLTKLEDGEAGRELADFLRMETVNHFGLAAEHYDFPEVARRIQAWYERGWRQRGDLITVYVALLNEGVDVWRPVQARPLGGDEFRLVGVEGEVSDEAWQFPAGSIVRCERRRLGGDSRLVAVECTPTG
jgi:hypothetical protein